MPLKGGGAVLEITIETDKKSLKTVVSFAVERLALD